MHMKFNSIAMRIFVLVIPAIIITTLVFSVISYYDSSARINATINEKMYDNLQAAELQIQFELYKNAIVAENFAKYAAALKLDTYNDEENHRVLADGILGNKNTFSGGIWFEPYKFDRRWYYFGTFVYRDNQDDIVYVSDYGDNVDYFAEDWFQKGRLSEGKLMWSKVYYDQVAGITMVTATQAFYNSQGNFLGVGTSDMNLYDIRAIVNSISVGETGRAFLLGSTGEYISFFDEDKNVAELMQNDAEPALAQLGQEIMANSSGTTTLERNGEKLRVYYNTMADVNWKLAITVQESEINSSALISFISMIGIPVLGLLCVMLGIFAVINYLRRIVSKVNAFADLAASGDFSRRIEVSETDEFGFMEQRLNIMITTMDDMNRHSAELLQIAEEASKSKSEFLSRMSHEIRTPMNAIIGMTQIAKASNDPAKIDDCLNKIDTASKHLLALINDILDMSKIEANKLELTAEEFSPRHTLNNICTMMQVKAEEKRQQLRLNINSNVPAYIVSDELRLSQVITNLIGNAIKFTPENGTIEVDMSEIGQEDECSVIQVSVKDNGIGLSPEQQGRLFTSFEQGDGSISRRFGGTGLGLAISRRIVELMNGRIWVESERGLGSTFRFTIKARGGADHGGGTGRQTEQLGKGDLKDLRILVADDSPEACEYMEHILESFHLSCDKVFDGEQALAAARQAIEQRRPYDIIFMDYVMPKLNGIEASEEIMNISSGSTAIIMVSIYDWDHLAEYAQGAGIIKHITKPFSPSNVMNVINEVEYGRVLGNIPLLDMQASGFSGNTILLAEDIEINREIVAALLAETQVSIDFAENGAQAVEMFRARPDAYDIILMDIQMPEMDGFEATRQIRAMELLRAKTIPIIAMTANALSEDVQRCREAGMNDHISKPIDLDILLLKLNDYFFMKDYLDNDIC